MKKQIFLTPKFVLSPYTTSPFPCTVHFELQILLVTCHHLHHCPTSPSRQVVALISGLPPHCPVQGLLSCGDPKSSIAVNCFICRNTAWKIKAMCLSFPCKWDRRTVSPVEVIRGQVLPPWGLADVSWGPESISASELPWLPLPVNVSCWESQLHGSAVCGCQPLTPASSPGNCPEILRLVEAHQGWRLHHQLAGFSLKPSRIFTAETKLVKTSSLAVSSSFENLLYHLLNLWSLGKFLNLS